jgi:hypothetical protein
MTLDGGLLDQSNGSSVKRRVGRLSDLSSE